MALSEATKYRREVSNVILDHIAERMTYEEMLDKLVRMVPPVYGVAEASEKLGMPSSNLAEKPSRRAPKGMPEPVYRIRATRLWLSSEIDEYAKAYAKRRQGSMEQRKQRAAA